LDGSGEGVEGSEVTSLINGLTVDVEPDGIDSVLLSAEQLARNRINMQMRINDAFLFIFTPF
jgi:hypothetical protein